jgi:hypothetical protein
MAQPARPLSRPKQLPRSLGHDASQLCALASGTMDGPDVPSHPPTREPIPPSLAHDGRFLAHLGRLAARGEIEVRSSSALERRTADSHLDRTSSDSHHANISRL